MPLRDLFVPSFLKREQIDRWAVAGDDERMHLVIEGEDLDTVFHDEDGEQRDVVYLWLSADDDDS